MLVYNIPYWYTIGIHQYWYTIYQYWYTILVAVPFGTAYLVVAKQEINLCLKKKNLEIQTCKFSTLPFDLRSTEKVASLYPIL